MQFAVDLGQALLIAVAIVSAFNTAIQYYSQVATYPLFAALPAGAFTPYHAAYERRLPASVHVPYGFLIGSNLVLIAAQLDGIGWEWPIAMLALNLAITPISLLMAVPAHTRLAAQGFADRAGMRVLLQANGLRLTVSAAATAIAFGLVLTH